MGKICPKCCYINEDIAKFCEECGEALSNDSMGRKEIEADTSVTPKINMYSQNIVPQITDTVVTTDNKILGIISLICGILSIVTFGCFYIPEIIAIVCGILSKDNKGKRTKYGKAGLVCGLIGIVLLIFIVIIGIALS